MADRTETRATGFAGLATLVSDVQGVIRDAERGAAAHASTKAAAGASSERASATASASPATTAAPQQPPVSKTTFRWGRLAAVGGFIGFLILINQDSDDAESRSTTSYSTPDPSASTALPGLSPAPDVLDERRPAAGGRERVLDMAEIRYCLAEEIRMTAAEAAVNSYNDAEVDRFNVYVDDYNSRCGQYRYRSGAVERARADVERYRASLQAEGRARFRTSGALPSVDLSPAVATNAQGAGTESPRSDPARRIEQRRTALRQEAERRAATPSVRRTPRERENLATCLSGEYPSLCDYMLLTQEERVRVEAAERRANYRTCISGEYPSLCRRELLTSSEVVAVDAAERRANYRTCISGQYPSLCRHDLLTAQQASAVGAAERRVNYQTCVSGLYPSLCDHSLLTPEQARLVAAAERRAGRP